MPGEPPFAASAFFSATSVPAVREFDYDDANRMHAVRHDGVVAMRYLYNAMGEWVHRAGSGIAVTTLYDEAGRSCRKHFPQAWTYDDNN